MPILNGQTTRTEASESVMSASATTTQPAIDDAPAPPVSLLHVTPVKTHMQNIDVLRSICMLEIILSHITSPFLTATRDHADAPLFVTVLTLATAIKFGVPCFLMISFFIYWHQLYEKGRSWGELLRRRFKRIFPAFIVWTTAYFLIYKLLWNTTGHNFCKTMDYRLLSWKSPEMWFRLYVLGKAEYHLYYLPVVIECLLLIPLLRFLWRRPLVSWLCVGVIVSCWYLASYGDAIAQHLGGGTNFFHAMRTIAHDQLTFPLLVYPILGMVFAGQVQWRKFIATTPVAVLWGLLFIAMALSVTESFLDMPHNFEDAIVMLKLGQLVGGVALFSLILRYPMLHNRFPSVSRHAFGLHFLHPMIILALFFAERAIFGEAVVNWQMKPGLVLVANYLMVFGITYCICIVVGRIKWLEFMVI